MLIAAGWKACSAYGVLISREIAASQERSSVQGMAAAESAWKRADLYTACDCQICPYEDALPASCIEPMLNMVMGCSQAAEAACSCRSAAM